jgi:magnesium-transporting ATPase (P-type)
MCGVCSKNMVFMGTLVRRGRGVAVVSATADNTEFGIIFKMLDVRTALRVHRP